MYAYSPTVSHCGSSLSQVYSSACHKDIADIMVKTVLLLDMPRKHELEPRFS